MDDAATPVPWRSVLPILGVMFVDGVNMMLVFPFVPFLVRSTLRLSLEDPNTPLMSGLMGAAFLLGQFFASPVYGPLSDRRGRRPVLLSCMAVSTAFLLAFGLAESYWFAMACRFLQGLSAGALTVGKLYLVDISDATNEARIFSYIGVAMGSGAICGPMLGGLLSNLPPASAPDGPIRLVLERYPYLPPCAAAAAMAGVVWLATALHLRETLHQGDASLSAALMAPPRTSPRLRTPRKPLSSGAAFVAGPARTTVAGGGPLPRGRGALAADAHAEGSEKGRRGPADAQADPARRSGCELVCQQLSRPCVLVGAEEVPPAVERCLSRRSASSRASSRSASMELGVAEAVEPYSPPPTSPNGFYDAASVAAAASLAADSSVRADRAGAFWLVQLHCFLFCFTVVGLSDVLPVFLATPVHHGGLGFSSSSIGMLQTVVGVTSILVALLLTYRVIDAFGPVGAMRVGLVSIALAPLLLAATPAAAALLPTTAVARAGALLAACSYMLCSVSRNLIYTASLTLSKACASGPPGVVFGINQQACFLGAMLGPIGAGLGYTAFLACLGSATYFFTALAALGGIAILVHLRLPPWPW